MSARLASASTLSTKDSIVAVLSMNRSYCTVQSLILSLCSVCTCWSGFAISRPISRNLHLPCIFYNFSSVSVSERYEIRVFHPDLALADYKYRELMCSRLQRGPPSMGKQTPQYHRPLAHRRWWHCTVNAPLSVTLRTWKKAWNFQGPGRRMLPCLKSSKYGPSITFSLGEPKPQSLIPWK
jgi:hypothetical protein